MIKQALLRASVVAMTAALALGGCATPLTPAAGSVRADGMAAYAAGDYDRAARLLRNHLGERPDDARAWYRLGNAEAHRGRLREAEAAYYRALEHDDGLARARHNLGLVHLRLGWQALRTARAALPPDPERTRRTLRYLGCLMHTLRAEPAQGTCGERPTAAEGEAE